VNAEPLALSGLYVARGGSGDRLLMLLHGMGANGSVWSRLLPLVAANWQGRWMVPDLRGHGRSFQRGPYAVGVHAADMAALIDDDPATSVTLVGHSFGGAVAAVLASGLFGIAARDVVAIGVKIRWTEEELAKAREMAERPARTFPSREQAIDRYLKMSGLAGLVDPQSPDATAGIADHHGGYRVTMDPRAFAAVGPSVEGLLRMSAAKLHLAAGADDPMVSLEDMRRIDPDAVAFDGTGHNAHWEAPDEVWRFIERFA